MNQSERADDAIRFVTRETASNAEFSCTLAIVGMLLVVPAVANHILLMLALFVNWRACRRGTRARQMQRRFEVGTDYTNSANIGRWLGGINLILVPSWAALCVISYFRIH